MERISSMYATRLVARENEASHEMRRSDVVSECEVSHGMRCSDKMKSFLQSHEQGRSFMPTFREFMRVAEVTVKDKTSGERMKEIYAVLKKHDAFKGLTPEKATSILEDLGPTFVKIGQLASNRSDILPREYCDAFKSLRTNVAPVEFSEIMQTIERNLGTSWTTVFSSFEETPLGSASIAQVYKATLKAGPVVAVKVRRPGIVPKMAEDIALIKHLLALAEFSTTSHEEGLLSIENLVSELERTTADEVDFTIELNNLTRFHCDLTNQYGVSSPLPYPEYSTEEVLVMEFVSGDFISDTNKLLARGVNLDEVGQRLADSYVTQVVDNGFFHADPHPGNIIVDDNTIIWVDLGMTGSLNEGEQALLGEIFEAIVAKDSYALKECLLALTKEKGEVDHGRLLEQIDQMISSYTSVSLSELDIGAAFMDVIDILQTQSLSLPPSFTMLARGLFTLEGVLNDIAPSTSVVNIISRHVKRKMLDPHYIATRTKDFLVSGVHSVEASAKLPSQISNTLEMLDRGEIKVIAEIKTRKGLLASLSTIAGRIGLAMISAGLFIGSSILCNTELKPEFLGVPLLGFLGFVGAFVLGVYVIWETIASQHKQVNDKD